MASRPASSDRPTRNWPATDGDFNGKDDSHGHEENRGVDSPLHRADRVSRRVSGAGRDSAGRPDDCASGREILSARNGERSGRASRDEGIGEGRLPDVRLAGSRHLAAGGHAERRRASPRPNGCLWCRELLGATALCSCGPVFSRLYGGLPLGAGRRRTAGGAVQAVCRVSAAEGADNRSVCLSGRRRARLRLLFLRQPVRDGRPTCGRLPERPCGA